ncbi:hypothetical protein ACLOAV_004620 [Pseudogymnoascus australis]
MSSNLQEMTTFIRRTGIPDALAGSGVVANDGKPWEEALSGGTARPRLNISRSHEQDVEVTMRFDIDAVIAEVSSLEAFRGLRFSYHPRPSRNLSKPIHVWFHGQRLHQCRHIRFGEAIHAQDIEIFMGFPSLPFVNETFLTQEHHALWIDEVVLLSLRSLLLPTSMQHFPATWAIGASKTRAKHNEHRTWDAGGTNAIHYSVKEPLKGDYLEVRTCPLVEEMLPTALASFDGPKGSCYKSTISCQRYKRRRGYEYYPTQKHFMHPDIVSAQRYSNYKALGDGGKVFPFTNLNIESVLVPTNLLQLWAKAGGAHGRSNNIEKLVSIAGKQSYLESKKRFELAHSDSLGESFGAREEYRILLEVFEDLYLNSRPCRHAEPRPYHSIPSEDAMLFVRWELDRWLGALDYLLKMKNQLTPESGAVGTMLARVIKTTSNDSAYGHSSDLYRDSYITKSGLQWLGLGFGQTVQDTGMVWLKPSCSTGSAYNSTSRFKARSDFLFPTLS